MTPRQRFLAAFQSGSTQGPLIRAIDLGGPSGSLPTPVYQAVRREFGLKGPLGGGNEFFLAKFGLSALDEELIEHLRPDTFWASLWPGEGEPDGLGQGSNPTAERRLKFNSDGSVSRLDYWGTVYQKAPGENFYQVVYSPLARATGPGDLKNYRFPALDGSFDEHWGRAAEKARASGQLALCFGLDGVLETAGRLMGAERLKAGLAARKALAENLLDRVAEAQLLVYGRLVSVLGDEIGALTVYGQSPGTQSKAFSWDAAVAGTVFPRQAVVFRALAEIGAGTTAVFFQNLGPAQIALAADLGAGALMAPFWEPENSKMAGGCLGGSGGLGGSLELGRLVGWGGPPARVWQSSDPEEARRLTAQWLESLDQTVKIVTPWSAGSIITDPAAAAAVWRVCRGQG